MRIRKAKKGAPLGAKQAQDKTAPALAIIDYLPPGQRPRLAGGAYDPYERPLTTAVVERVQRPRTDLRRLSSWIKAKKEVEAQRDNDEQENKPRDR